MIVRLPDDPDGLVTAPHGTKQQENPMHCTNCHAASHGSQLCRHCAATTLNNLNQLTWLLDELEVNLCRLETQPRSVVPVRNDATNPPLIYNPETSELIDHINTTLQHWADHYATALSVIGSTGPITWLTHHNPHITSTQPDAATYAQTIQDLTQQATHHINPPQPTPDTDAPTRLQHHLNHANPLLTTKQACQLGIPRHTINNHTKRGTLTPHHGKYKLQDLLKLAQPQHPPTKRDTLFPAPPCPHQAPDTARATRG